MQRIFVGDVQGCAAELEALIERAEAKFGPDFTLWVVGDLVNRGPQNLRALEIVRERVEAGRAEYVLGNHEIFLISVALGLRGLRPSDSIGDVLESADASDWIDWLRARPLVVPGEIDGQRFAMLHAAADPDWSLAELVGVSEAISERLAGSATVAREFLASDPTPGSARDHLGRLTRCRSVTADGGWSSDEPAAPEFAWHAAWARRRHDYGIVYGHWSRQGLHFAPGLRGLDTGCVHHGRGRDGFLTAWLPDTSDAGTRRTRAFELPDERIWQVPARRRYYDPEARAAR